ncbi:reverse transcriptase domain-containing protein [Tanacetum coccineum]
MILQGLKTRLGKAKGQWVEELPNVLWGYRTTAHPRNGCTPFSLVYGSEVVLPLEIGLPTYRISTFQPATNNTGLRLNLDLIEEQREMASLRNARYSRIVKALDSVIFNSSFTSSASFGKSV